MKMIQNDLLKDLQQRTESSIAKVEAMQQMSLHQLNYRTYQKSWSALECIEHLNRYSAFYLPEIESKIKGQGKVKPDTSFRSGWLGNYFAKSVSNKPKVNKMKTFAEMNPLGSDLTGEVLDQFLADQTVLLTLLESCHEVDLTKTKTAISISKLLKLRLGDTLRVLIYHNERHIAQAQRAIEKA